MVKHGNNIDLLTVYISEAHAEDTWPLGLPVSYNQTHTLEERARVARDFLRDNAYPYPLVLDAPPKNAFNALFAAWPLRFYVFDDNRLSFLCEPYGTITD